MGTSVAEAQERISSSEFSEWTAYESISPIGERRDDLRFALLAYTIGCVMSSSNADVDLQGYLDLFDFESDREAEPIGMSSEALKMVFDVGTDKLGNSQFVIKKE